MNKNDIRKSMGTLPEDNNTMNYTIKKEKDSLQVDLIDFNKNPFRVIFSTATATWGNNEYQDKWLLTSKEDKLKVIVAALTGRTLPQALENIIFTWRIKGTPRMTFNKHTEVAKIGCTFYSIGCRDNNKLDTDFIIRENVQVDYEQMQKYFKESKELYKDCLDTEGGSWQSARAFLPLAYQHSYHFSQNMLSFLRMYPRMDKDPELSILYNKLLDSLNDKQLTLFYVAIKTNKRLKEATQNEIFDFSLIELSELENKLINEV